MIRGSGPFCIFRLLRAIIWAIHVIRAISNSILSLVYPQPCLACGGPVESYSDGVACSACWSATRIFSGYEALCPKCGAFLGESSNLEKVNCRQCLSHFFDSAHAAGVYEKALAASVLNLKRTPFIASRTRLAFLRIFERIPSEDSRVIIPVPLSKRRFLERGFNQAEVLATIVAKQSGIRMEKNNLIRKKHTPIHRTAMDKKARELTVRDAFEVRFPRLVQNQNILLVDDVFTSGATVSYCAKELKKKGARKVDVMTLARAVL